MVSTLLEEENELQEADPAPLPIERGPDHIKAMLPGMLINMLKQNCAQMDNPDFLRMYEGNLDDQSFISKVVNQFLETNQLDSPVYEQMVQDCFWDKVVKGELQTFHDAIKDGRTSTKRIRFTQKRKATAPAPVPIPEIMPVQEPELTSGELKALGPYEILEDGNIKNAAKFMTAFGIEYNSNLDKRRDDLATSFMYGTMSILHDSKGKKTGKDADFHSTLLYIFYHNRKYVVGFMHHISDKRIKQLGLEAPIYEMDAILPGVTYHGEPIIIRRTYGLN